MWIKITQTKWANTVSSQMVDTGEIETKLATLQAQLPAFQTAYDDRVTLAESQTDEEVKTILRESCEAFYAPILQTQEEVAKLQGTLADIYGNNI